MDRTWGRSTLLGDMGGIRSFLGQYGVTLQATEVSEYLDNTRGGLKTGGTYDGLTTVTLGLDTQKAFGLPGGTFNASALQIHGRNLSEFNLGTLNTASGIEAQDTTRLWELWYQQSFLNKRVDVKVGQQSIDQEFMVSSYAATFVNTMFGWPGLPSYDMPSGGPAYPLSGLGVRVRGQITPSLTALAGVFDADPLGNNPNNLSGTNFNLHNGAMYIGELQYSINQPSDGEMVGVPQSGLPGTYKIGFWYNNERFADQSNDNTGLSLANPLSSGTPQNHNGNYSFYAVADQMIWRPNPDEPRSIGVFARVMGAPGDRNLVSFSANAGIVMKAPFAGRDNDSVGIGLAYIKVGNHVHDLDIANAAQAVARTVSARRKRRSRRPISTRSTRGGSCRAICNTPSTRAPARIRTIPRSRCATRSSSACAPPSLSDRRDLERTHPRLLYETTYQIQSAVGHAFDHCVSRVAGGRSCQQRGARSADRLS
jgi:porin